MERMPLETTASRGLYRARPCPSLVVYQQGGRWVARAQQSYVCADANPEAWLGANGLGTASFQTLDELCCALAEAHEDVPLPSAQTALPNLVAAGSGYTGMNGCFQVVRGNASTRWRLYRVADLVTGDPLAKRELIVGVHTLAEARRWMRYVCEVG
jgi:hypothetical protein